MVNLLLASTSTIHGGKYLDYLKDEVVEHFAKAQNLYFIPFARPGGMSHDDYAKLACEKFGEWGLNMRGLHTAEDMKTALQQADGVFTGGGNTFVLVKQLYELGLMTILKERVQSGMPYMGSSAGSNLAGMSVRTTNDMPIVYPPSFDALAAVPFNINPHYLDPQEGSKHMGETRETRIKEFHHFNQQPVLGLREGSWLRVSNDKVFLKGKLSARLFRQGSAPTELSPGEIHI
jgi:dipeptidase E